MRYLRAGEIGFRPQRGLILVSKLLQYIVNGLTFEPSHELYDLNDFVVAQVQHPCFSDFLIFIFLAHPILSLICFLLPLQIPAFEKFIDKILTIKS